VLRRDHRTAGGRLISTRNRSKITGARMQPRLTPTLTKNGSDSRKFLTLAGTLYHAVPEDSRIYRDCPAFLPFIEVGNGEGRHLFPQNWGKYSAGKYHVKFEHFVNFSYIQYIVGQKCLAPEVD